MPSRASKKRPRDFAQLAKSIVKDAIGEKLDGLALPPEPPDTRNQAALALSKLVASKGGKATARITTPRSYSPAVCLGCKTQEASGDPDPKHISTS